MNNKLNTTTQLLQTVVTGCFSSLAENVIVTTGSDFSGVGAFDQALERLGIKQNKKFACDMDKYARQTYIYNFGEPDYYPENVYDREIPKESLDIYMTSPPCQSFSLAGKRKGEDSKNGVLFYNSHEFIVKNNPRYFIFENVKGLLSDDNGKTFQRWIDYLGGKSVNGNPVIFPHENATPYHVYYQVMNAKHYGVPQNRERIFIIGIRDDADNDFKFPKPFHLEKRLKDVLENEVDEKYFLSDSNINALIKYNERQVVNERGFSAKFRDVETVKTMDALKCGGGGKDDLIKIGAIRGRNPQNPLSRVSGLPTEQMLEINENGTSNALTTVQKDNVVVIPAPIVEYQLTGGKWDKTHEQSGRVYDKNGIAPTIHTMGGGNQEPKIMTKQQIEKFNDLEVDENIAGCITHAIGRMGSSDEYISSVKRNAIITQRIRRLTPRECFNLMDFNQEMIDKTIESKLISDSQLYKQAGNSICVGVLAAIIEKINL